MTKGKEREECKDIDMVLYHANCPDGTGSALAVYMYMKKNMPKKKVRYKPVIYGEKPDIEELRGLNVLICDFSYKEYQMRKIIEVTKKVVIIDHHKSAEKTLQSIDEKYKIFDMNHSGAILTWNYMMKNEDPPLLLKYIEDRDIWKNEMRNTEAFHAWISTIPNEIEEYEKYIDPEKLLGMIMMKGKIYMELNEYYVKQSIKKTIIKFVKISEKYYFVAFTNMPIPALKSKIGNGIFKEYPSIDFASVYSVNAKNTSSISLRSTDKHVDVSKIATALGGGGHRNASGLWQNTPVVKLGELCDNGNLFKCLKQVSYGMIKVGREKYETVYMNSRNYQRELGEYLLQVKYKETYKTMKRKVQNSLALRRLRDGERIYMAYDVAIVWYDTGYNKYYTVSYRKGVKVEEQRRIAQQIKKICKLGLFEAGAREIQLEMQIY